MKRVAKYGTGWMPYMYTPDMLAESMGKIADFSVEAGRPADAVQAGLFIFTCVHESRDRALELANEQLSKQYNQDFTKLVDKYTISGSPDDCIEQINAYRQAGAETIIFAQGCPPNYAESNTRLIGESILPAFA